MQKHITFLSSSSEESDKWVSCDHLPDEIWRTNIHIPDTLYPINDTILVENSVGYFGLRS